MKRIFRRIAAFASAAVLSVGAAAMFAGCTSNNPEVKIVYSFNGNTYEVEYVLSRSDAPQTVQHFIELADAGYYNGTCIHNYTSTALYGGGYTYENGELQEKDYFAEVKRLEKEGNSFTQSVYIKNNNEKVPLYTVCGEFSNNRGYVNANREYMHMQGALVMYYTDKSESARDVTVLTDPNGEGEEISRYYSMNSATSLFYTYTGVANNVTLDNKYAVFGMAKDYQGQFQPLIDAVNDYTSGLVDDEETEEDESSFTTTVDNFRLDTLDHTEEIFPDIGRYFYSVRINGQTANFKCPVVPIVIESVTVTKY